jgi:hypothetical protein
VGLTTFAIPVGNLAEGRDGNLLYFVRRGNETKVKERHMKLIIIIYTRKKSTTYQVTQIKQKQYNLS